MRKSDRIGPLPSAFNREISKLLTCQLLSNAVSPIIDCIPVTEIAFHRTREANDRPLTKREKRRIVASRKRTQLLRIDTREHGTNPAGILRNVLGDAVHSNGKSPHRHLVQFLRKTLHKIMGAGHPLSHVDSGAANNSVKSFKRVNILRRFADNFEAISLQPASNRFCNFCSCPMLRSCSQQNLH